MSECPLFPGILVGVAGFVWFTFMAAMPTVVATLRYVEPLQRSLALGFATIFFRLLGSIPGPLAFGRYAHKDTNYFQKIKILCFETINDELLKYVMVRS